jgi:hypothetical protein
VTSVTVVGRDATHARVSADARFADILDASLGQPRMVWFALFAIREYHSHEQLVHGRGGGAPSLPATIQRQGFDNRQATLARRIHTALAGLYAEHDEGSVRGVLLEKLVEQQIRSRYGGTDHLCDNNVKVRVAGSDPDHTTSTSIDVIGFDGSIGEGHDCKADSKRFVKYRPWITELDEKVARPDLSIGLVTADSSNTARRKMGSFRPQHLILIGEEHLFTRLPLR